MPMAQMTCEDSREPEVQVDPLEAAIPSLLSNSRMPSPSTYSKASAGGVGQAVQRVAVDEGVGRPCQDAAREAVAKFLYHRVSFGHVRHGQVAGDAEADDGGRILRDGAAPAFLVAAAQQQAETTTSRPRNWIADLIRLSAPALMYLVPARFQFA